MPTNKKIGFTAGVYLFETLTSGMYNDPLSVYREYIQNAVDSIDLSNGSKNKQVAITIVPVENNIIIRDNACGIRKEDAFYILNGIGISNKKGVNSLRGFRGIGRLGGIAFSNRVIFTTKFDGEDRISRQEWDCMKLREILHDPQLSKMKLEKLLREVSTFSQIETSHSSRSFFEVKMEGVSSFRSYLTDLKRVREYISRVAPINFNLNSFPYGEEINQFLKSKVLNYGYYNILLNNKPVLKPYKREVKITKTGFDEIVGVKTFDLTFGGEVAAYGWYGVRKDLIGSIVRGDDSAGIAVRVGNILLGDSHLLDRCFKENRFNSYLVGEIHVVHPELIPNSRRDDFVDNRAKALFYSAIEREIGFPFSKEIRARSRIKSTEAVGHSPSSFQDSESKNGDFGNSKVVSSEKGHIESISHKNSLPSKHAKAILDQILHSCRGCECIEKILRGATGEPRESKKVEGVR